MMQSLVINRERERSDYSVHDESNFKTLKQRIKIKVYLTEKLLSI